jgi:iron complex transport system substrate-binding protein
VTGIPVLAGLIAVLAAGPSWAAPQRVVSINLCADQLLLTLLPRNRLVSVTHLASDPALSMMANMAEGLEVNHGQADEVVRMRPDLVVAGRYSQSQTVTLLRAVGIDVLELDVPASIDGLTRLIDKLGSRLDVPRTATEVTGRLRRDLAALDRSSATQRPLVALYRVNRGTEGRDTLIGELMHRAGMANLADELDIRRWGTLPLESLLMARPDILILERSGHPEPALAHEVLHHPALSTLTTQVHTVEVANRDWSCAGPWLTQALAQLVRARTAWAKSNPASTSGRGQP